MAKKILIIAGEASGDLYGANLVHALRKKYPDAEFSGVGGVKMKEAGVKIVFPIDELAIMGISEIFFKLKTIKDLFFKLSDKVDTEKFDLGVLVNYPGFNLKFAKVLKSKNVPVVFYSSPQVWAWGKWRLNTIKKFVDKMIVFLKFEEDFYKKNGVEAEFVGHPLVDIVKKKGADLGIKKSGKIISLVPGSRKSEIKNLFPTMIKAAEIIHSKDNNAQFLVTKHPELPFEIYQNTMKNSTLPIKIVEGKTYDCLNISDLAIVASGSVTLEAAILKTPMVITYRVSFLTGVLYLIFKRLAHLGLVNIVAGKRIMPELLQYNASARNIARESIDILSNGKRYDQMRENLEFVNNLIGPSGASDRASEIISRILK